ncbi:MAG TPA: sulfate transporter CysZ [Gammaproteobacteria bacterium]|nr:sulfate transporter CysZ [Gammaproteobacteria bacterium]
MKSFLDGVDYLFSGFGLIARPGLKRFVIIPLVINIILFSILFVLLSHYAGMLHDWVSGYLPSWMQWLSTIIWLVFFLGFFFVFIYAFAALGAITAAPFNGLLAEKVEMVLTGKIPQDRGLFENIKDMPRIISRQFAILFFYLPRAVIILVLFFIPVVHWLAIVLWFVFSAWFLALQYIDFPTDNHKIPVAKVREWLNDRRAVTLGFGISLMFVMSIPVLNFIAIPAAAAGAAKFWVEENRQRTPVK